MSLPEVSLVLEIHRRTRAEDLHTQARAAFLASAAKWGEGFSADFNALLEDFADVVATKVAVAPQRATKRQLAGLFGALGIPTQS